jgi:hypothetical protein
MQRALKVTTPVEQLRSAEEQQQEQTEILDYWLQQWAAWMHNNAAELRRELGYGNVVAAGRHALTNYCAAEDDSGLTWDMRREKTVNDIDTVVTDLKRQMPWTWWAICRRHGLSSVWHFPRLDPDEAYWNAVEELQAATEERGMVL